MLTVLLSRDQLAGTDEILQRLSQDVALEKPNRILIVPELISHDMERRLCAAAGDTASRFAQVLTFPRLANRITELVGQGPEPCMDNGGRVVAMASAAHALAGQLKAYAALETKPEFLMQLVDAVDEFKRCCITSDDLSRASEQIAGENSLFAQKLSELSLLLEGYDAICQRGKRDPRDLMNWVLDQLYDSEFGQNHCFYVDGFPDFTRQHMAILEHLMQVSPHVTICLNCDMPDSHAMAYEKAGQTARDILRYANANGIACKVEHVKPRCDALAPVRDMLFQGTINPQPELQECVRMKTAPSVYQACRNATQTVLDLTRQGCRYRDIALVCTDLNTYRAPLRLSFHRCGIPLYLAGNEDILQQGPIMTVLTALEAVLSGLEQRDVLHYFRSSLSPLTLSECDCLENYAVIWSISGKRWLEPWQAHPDGLSGRWDDASHQRLEELNGLRQRAMEPLRRLSMAMKRAVGLKQQVQALYDFLETIDFAHRLEQTAQQLRQNGDRRGAQICSQLWEILLSALEQLHDVLGDTHWEQENFTRLLRLLLSQYDVGTIPPVLDAVTAGDISAMHCQREKHLILLGAEEGLFPGYSGSSGVLTDQERVLLRRLSLPLTGGSLEGLQSELAEIFGVFCGAQETVTLVCCEEPSFIYRRLQSLTGAAPGTVTPQPQTADDAAAMLLACDDEAGAQSLGLGAQYLRLRRAKDYSFGFVQPQRITALYGKRLTLSASQVDRQAECRLSYFLQYGLRAKERRQAGVDPAEFGTYVHHVLECTAREVMRRGGFQCVDLDTTLRLAGEFADAYAREHYSQLDSQRMEYLFRRNMQELELVVQELWEELHDAQFRPVRFELQFSDDGAMPPVNIPGANLPARLRGFVDRVDLWEQGGTGYVRVVDYKTGKKDFDYCDIFNGVGLQMLHYLFALEDGGQAITGDRTVPAGVQYFPARVSYVTADGPDDEQWRKQRRRQWVRKGLLLQQEDVLQAMDPSEELDRLNCKRLKDGTITGDLADRGQLIELKHYVMKVLRRMVNEIASGNVEPNPYTRGSSHNACTFCPYGMVCHAQDVTGRRNYQAMTAQRFWEEIGKELEHG